MRRRRTLRMSQKPLIAGDFHSWNPSGFFRTLSFMFDYR